MNKIILLSFSLQQQQNEKKESENIEQYFMPNYNPSLGIIYLGTWLSFHGYETTVIDIGCESITAKELLQKIKETNPIFLGISAYTENIDMCYQFAKVVREKMPNIKIVFGGPHPSLMPNEVIKNESIDFVSRNEGECTLLELAEAISSNEKYITYDQIDNLVFKRDSKIIKNKHRHSIHNLDLLPIPKRELVDINRYNTSVTFSTSRGCPGRCIYCAATSLSGATYRIRSVANVFLEIVLLKTQLKDKLKKIDICDDTFTAIPNRVKEFTQYLKKYNYKIPWYCESRIDVMTEEMLDCMAESHCYMIQYGMESGSQTVLDKINKGINFEHAKRVIDLTHKKGIHIFLSFMLGHYCDTRETMSETCNFIKDCFKRYKADMSLSFNTPFPGTWQYTHMEELGMRLVTKGYKNLVLGKPNVETDNFTIYDQLEFYYNTNKYLWYSTRALYEIDTNIKGEEA